jgi:hypothetical protein
VVEMACISNRAADERRAEIWGRRDLEVTDDVSMVEHLKRVIHLRRLL